MMTTSFSDDFDFLLQRTLRARADVATPARLEQRLLANLALTSANAAKPKPLFATAELVRAPRSGWSSAFALGAHAVALVLVFVLAQRALHVRHVERPYTASMELLTPPPVASKANKMGGGGGSPGTMAATQGHLSKFEAQPLLPPMMPPKLEARLEVAPAINVQTDLKMADNKMPELGIPNSSVHGVSLGNGRGSGIGSGDGNGMGPGSGGGNGGGVFHVGGSVLAPTVLYQVEPDFSDEARKAKFSGDVQVYLWVDEHGNPSHIRVARGVGMGLDEKAVEAVRQYKFKPATVNGKPVKVDLYIEVDFRIF